MAIIFLIKTHGFLDFEYSFISQMKRKKPKKMYTVYIFNYYSMRKNKYMRHLKCKINLFYCLRGHDKISPLFHRAL